MTTFPIKRIVIALALLLIAYLVVGSYLNYRQTPQLSPNDFDVNLLETAEMLTLVRFVETSLTHTAQPKSPLVSLTLAPYNASMSPTVPFRLSHTPTPTPPPYDASMSPTAPLPPELATQWVATMTARALTPSVTPSPASAVRDSNCAFSWARQDLLDVTSLVQTALNEAGITYVTARAEAYGENCVRQDQSISYFAAMTSDFYLTIPIDTLANDERTGQVVAAVYRMLVALPADSLPARLGYLDITFTAGDQSQHFRAMFDQLRPFIDAGKTGAALLAAGVG